MARNAGVDAMVLAKIRELRERAKTPALAKRSRPQTKKRKAKRKAGRKGRRGKRK